MAVAVSPQSNRLRSRLGLPTPGLSVDSTLEQVLLCNIYLFIAHAPLFADQPLVPPTVDVITSRFIRFV